MDPLSNPYTPGAGARPRELAGRDSELEAFDLLVGRLGQGSHERSRIIRGLRGVGKTVLLNELEDRAQSQGWGASLIEMQASDGYDFRSRFADHARTALIRSDLGRRAREVLRQATGLLQAFKLSVGEGGRWEVGLDLEAALVTSGDLETDLTELIVELGAACRKAETGMLFLIDEMQLLERAELEALVAAMHRASQEQLPVALVGAGLPPLRSQVIAAKTYAERLFRYPELGPLAEPDARRALERPARHALAASGGPEVTFAPEATERTLELSGCYPYFLQEYGAHVWQQAEGPVITVEDVEHAAPLALEQLDREFFASRIEKASARGHAYLAAMASLGEGPHRTADVAEAAGYRNQQAASVARSDLIDAGLIYAPKRGWLDFTVPHFAAYMRRAGNGT